MTRVATSLVVLLSLLALVSLVSAVIVSTTPYGLARLNGPSMAPTLEQGDPFLLIPPLGGIQKGDIVVYRSTSGDLITHRVVATTPEGYVTKGDNNTRTDQALGQPPVARDDILGKAFILRL